MRIELESIGTVVEGRADETDDHWGGIEATIELDGRGVTGEATRGLGDFSHIEVIYQFHLVDPNEITTGARHPRGRTDWPEVGILAQRAKNRPNRIGVTVCELVAVAPRTLRVRGLDAVAGTPVLDVKPYFPEFGPRGPVREPAWAEELMRHYWEPPGANI